MAAPSKQDVETLIQNSHQNAIIFLFRAGRVLIDELHSSSEHDLLEDRIEELDDVFDKLEPLTQFKQVSMPSEEIIRLIDQSENDLQNSPEKQRNLLRFVLISGKAAKAILDCSDCIDQRLVLDELSLHQLVEMVSDFVHIVRKNVPNHVRDAIWEEFRQLN